MTSEVIDDEPEFYSRAEEYWRQTSPTVDGMLGGYGHISSIDIAASRKFLLRFLDKGEGGGGSGKTGRGRALDCGAGIGRITKRLLLPLFRCVDLVDVTPGFLERAKAHLGPEASSRVGNFYCCGLQDFCFGDETYDVVWIQWVIGHLTDEHLVGFLARCRGALRPGGVVCIKDNMASQGVVLDEADSSVCRELSLVRALVERSGLRVVAQEPQDNFPKEIYTVWTLAMQ